MVEAQQFMFRTSVRMTAKAPVKQMAKQQKSPGKRAPVDQVHGPRTALFLGISALFVEGKLRYGTAYYVPKDTQIPVVILRYRSWWSQL